MDAIRQLTNNDVDASLALSQFAFQFELSAEEIEERKKKIKPERSWGYFIDDQIAAKLSILPFQTWIHGKVFDMGGIAGVASWPEHRRQGMVGKLIAHSLQVMRENKQYVSFLAPFSFPFYRKYGWEMHGEYKKYTITVHQLPQLGNSTGVMKRVAKEISLLKPIYEEFARQFNGMLIRNEEWWTDTVFSQNKGDVSVYYNEHGEARGYLFYSVKNKEMEVEEIVYLDHDAYIGLCNFIKNHDSMIEKVKMEVSMNDPLPFLMSSPNIQQEIVPYFMVRIVDVLPFIAQYPFQSLSQPIVLEVKDEYALWNNGIFLIQPQQDGTHQVIQLEKEKYQQEGWQEQVVSCDIQTLSTMLLGYQSPHKLAEFGRLRGSETGIHTLESTIPKRTTFLLDFF